MDESGSRDGPTPQVADWELRQRVLQDLRGRLPAGTDFVVDVAYFVDADVGVTYDRKTYIVTFCLFVGLNEDRYKRALRYCVDLILDHQRGEQPPTDDTMKPSTRFPTGTGLSNVLFVTAGATADIYRAIDPRLGRVVAVKVFRDSAESTLTLALREAQRLVSVDRHVMPRLYSYGSTPRSGQDVPYLVLEWRHGKPLSDPATHNAFLRIPYGRRLHHFIAICDAMSSLHRSGQIHGDVHGGNVLYDEVDDEISLIDFSSSLRDDDDDHAEFWLTDVEALAQFFLMNVCVPPLPIYTELVTGASTVRELLAFLRELPLAPAITSLSPTTAELARHAEERYLRMSQWLHRFRQEFEISIRVTFNHNQELDEPLHLHFDKSSHRAMVECGSVYSLHDEFRTFSVEMIRIFMRDWTFRQRRNLARKAHKRLTSTRLALGDRSKPLTAGAGLSREELLEGWASVLDLSSESLWHLSELGADERITIERMAEDDESERKFAAFFACVQSVHEAIVTDWLLAVGRTGRFGEFTAQQLASLERLGDDRASFASGSVFRLLKLGAEFVRASLTESKSEVLWGSLSESELEVLSALERRCARFYTCSTAALGVFAEGIAGFLSTIDVKYIITPSATGSRELAVHLPGTWQLASPLLSGGVSFRYVDANGGESFVEVRESEIADLAAIMVFEKAARGLSSESFYCGRMSVHGRVGFGNVLGIGHHFGKFQDGGWEENTNSIVEMASRVEGGSDMLRVRLREQFENYSWDIRRAVYDGRVAVNDGLSFDCIVTLRSCGLTTLEKYASVRNDDEIINKWAQAQIELVLQNITEILAAK